ncbi:hypothetical protein EST38_g5935 [Candolleomyces aberdarensis]|uniref:NAD-dependent epimerase/dehydratase domain-containing protein n=1 Tax=Candolleomyces aberdarensis TaxID=2316362 RepID=A0A4Q2DJ79_9AGAR|nr:hypothetical protein EST38_g5935 [Candolleomyces aberdarensis]
MSTLLTGGTSQIGLAIAKLLKEDGKDVIFGTRTPSKVPSEYKHVLLDWADPSTFENPFNSTEYQIDNVYILPAPLALSTLGITKPFIDLAIEKGVKKFALMSAAVFEKGGVVAGDIHEYLDSKPNLDYFVLQPTWFIENLFNTQGQSGQEQREIVTVVPKGRIPFVSVQDIAQAAFEYITQGSSTKDKVIIGPEALTYDEVAQILSEVVGKPFTHRVISPEEQEARYTSYGITPEYAKFLVAEEVKTDGDTQAALVDKENKYVGKFSVRDVVEKNKAFWSS